MVKYLLLIITLILIGSCAIQGTITGGPIDKRAPMFDTLIVKPTLLNSISFRELEVIFPFDEFITLNKPNETIMIVPSDFKIEASAKDKLLTLKLNGEPKPNTTYAIYLNNAVKDLHEGNDTLLTHIFSTGSYFDSISYKGKVIDARTRMPSKGATVALFLDTCKTFQQKAINFTLTNDKGEYTLKYIHPGKYYVVAFQDQNKDFIPQAFELSGFKSEMVELTKSIIDSSSIELFPHLPKKAIRKISHVNNEEILITGNIPIDKANITLFKQSILSKKTHKSDSISLFINTKDLDTVHGSLAIDQYLDTFYCRIQPKLNHKIPKLYFPKYVKPRSRCLITTNDLITSVNKDSIQLFINDSIKIPFEIKASGYQLEIKPTSYSSKTLKLIIKPSGLTFNNFREKYNLTQTINVFDSTQFGIFNVTTTIFPTGTILEVLTSDKITHQHVVDEKHNIWKIDDLEKGAYVFKAYFDTNKNGKWDTGNLQNKVQCEKIQIYNEPFQARPNWEVEVKFDPSKWK
jgi:uncharacterized protein (DUF2141 family)